jgi:hypothetical protein
VRARSLSLSLSHKTVHQSVVPDKPWKNFIGLRVSISHTVQIGLKWTSVCFGPIKKAVVERKLRDDN